MDFKKQLPDLILIHSCPVIDGHSSPLDTSILGIENADAARHFDILLEKYPEAYERRNLRAIEDINNHGHEWAKEATGRIASELTRVLQSDRGRALINAFAGNAYQGAFVIDRDGQASGRTYSETAPLWNQGVVICPSGLSKANEIALAAGQVLYTEGMCSYDDHVTVNTRNNASHEICHQIDKSYAAFKPGERLERQHSGTKIFRMLVDIEDYYLPHSVARMAYDTAMLSGYWVRCYDGDKRRRVKYVDASYAECFAQMGDFFTSSEHSADVSQPLSGLYFRHIVDLDLELLNSALDVKAITRARQELYRTLITPKGGRTAALGEKLRPAVEEVRSSSQSNINHLNFTAQPEKVDALMSAVDATLLEIAGDIRNKYGMHSAAAPVVMPVAPRFTPC